LKEQNKKKGLRSSSRVM